MRIFELGDNKRGVLLDGKLNIKETTIFESLEGDIFRTISKKIMTLNYERFEKFKKEINTIAMSPTLFQYLQYLARQKQMYLDESLKSDIKQIFGLKIVIRDDYEIDEVDFYRDVTSEY